MGSRPFLLFDPNLLYLLVEQCTLEKTETTKQNRYSAVIRLNAGEWQKFAEGKFAKREWEGLFFAPK